MWVKVVGWIILAASVVEIYTGAAWEKTGLVHRQDRPFLFWLSVICKTIVGIAIINLDYLRSVYGQ